MNFDIREDNVTTVADERAPGIPLAGFRRIVAVADRKAGADDCELRAGLVVDEPGQDGIATDVHGAAGIDDITRGQIARGSEITLARDSEDGKRVCIALDHVDLEAGDEGRPELAGITHHKVARGQVERAGRQLQVRPAGRADRADRQLAAVQPERLGDRRGAGHGEVPAGEQCRCRAEIEFLDLLRVERLVAGITQGAAKPVEEPVSKKARLSP